MKTIVIIMAHVSAGAEWVSGEIVPTVVGVEVRTSPGAVIGLVVLDG
ncbi:hypothetical protein [Planomonospora venezuelensis]|uniref:Uncharacterized protein n=1 Tax=Planomonospora venezuelensis TaxID=1999 RepID=A0A841DG46_PLAVE|nr:hypothetical protein [Planomonospora venezuelensis]MBB5967987.1 hypothetical protein [Planomonospora venezuelensis]